mmetsp:Transcript_24136/g.48265  ORF Transcript_24136/g.48265 Transcript_24136/m.48265 type:complete len:362 (-) Transcript_24136:665-1750(-)
MHLHLPQPHDRRSRRASGWRAKANGRHRSRRRARHPSRLLALPLPPDRPTAASAHEGGGEEGDERRQAAPLSGRHRAGRCQAWCHHQHRVARGPAPPSLLDDCPGSKGLFWPVQRVHPGVAHGRIRQPPLRISAGVPHAHRAHILRLRSGRLRAAAHLRLSRQAGQDLGPQHPSLPAHAQGPQLARASPCRLQQAPLLRLQRQVDQGVEPRIGLADTVARVALLVDPRPRHGEGCAHLRLQGQHRQGMGSQEHEVHLHIRLWLGGLLPRHDQQHRLRRLLRPQDTGVEPQHDAKVAHAHRTRGRRPMPHHPALDPLLRRLRHEAQGLGSQVQLVHDTLWPHILCARHRRRRGGPDPLLGRR